MADAKRDANRVPTILGTSNADGVTPVAIKADPSTHTLKTADGTTGSDLSATHAPHDNNFVAVLTAVSNSDGITPVIVYADPATGELLIKST